MIHIGDVFGIYTIIEDTNKISKDGHRIFLIECNVCHKRFTMPSNWFAYGKKMHHRCTHDRANAKVIKNKRLVSIFRGMYYRCYNVYDKDYPIYGKKGVYICD